MPPRTALPGRHRGLDAASGGAETGISGGESGFGGGSGEDMFRTVQPGGLMKDMQAVLARAREQGRDPSDLTEEEKREIRALVAQEESQRGGRKTGPRPQIMKNAPEVERCSARLRHLCRLIVRDRRPYCPANGILFLVPFAGAASGAPSYPEVTWSSIHPTTTLSSALLNALRLDIGRGPYNRLICPPGDI